LGVDLIDGSAGTGCGIDVETRGAKHLPVAIVSTQQAEAGAETLACLSLYNLDGDSLASFEVGGEADLAVNATTELALDEVLVDHATTAGMSLNVEAMRLEYVRRAVGAD
jgi:hypothetical protein